MKVEKYPTESQKLQDAIKKARRLFKGLAKEYTEDTVKKAFFRVQQTKSCNASGIVWIVDGASSAWRLFRFDYAW